MVFGSCELQPHRLTNIADNRQTEMIGASCTAAVCVYAVLRPSTTAASAGFAITCALEMTNKIFWTTANMSGLQVGMTSIERVAEYDLVEQEPRDGVEPPPSWPKKDSSIEVKNLSLRYASHLPMVVNDLSFTIGPGEKVRRDPRRGVFFADCLVSDWYCWQNR